MAPDAVQFPNDARRVVVRGASGSGKTTLARRIGHSLGIPHVELDGIYHQAAWTPLDDDAFHAAIVAFKDDDHWVACGNYHKVTGPLLERADTVVLLDLPRRTVMSRVVRRSLRRAVLREELWNGNKERFSQLFRADPEASIIAWAWTTHARYHREIASFVASPPRGDLRVVHVTSASQLRALVRALEAARARDVARTTTDGGSRHGP